MKNNVGEAMFLRTDLAIETINAEKIAENGVKVEEERHGKIIKTRQKTAVFLRKTWRLHKILPHYKNWYCIS